MDLTLKQKYDIIVNTLRLLGSYEPCDCGCPDKRKARIIGTPAVMWVMAAVALKEIGETEDYEENSPNRQST